ncbi:hypothetical protein [Roseateles koreensis]|uniref:General secretion pathway protein C n=1 Tax=Roseateles koreensis TaxID=2987526 RepID=A0ABT5KRF0_9BURK|nr:hypothetical protein [Roseateles koreensis]MDC8785464.1 hypothetical protein [Roseateles koreensis]
MLARIMAFGVWGLLACSGGYWLIQLLAKPLPTPVQAVAVGEQGGPVADLTRLLGAPEAAAVDVAPAIDSRFKLLGVVAPKNEQQSRAGEGVALIAVDGVARTVRIGAVLDGDIRLIAVDKHSAKLGAAGVVSIQLQMAAPVSAATGALPPAQASLTNLGGAPLPVGAVAGAPIPGAPGTVAQMVGTLPPTRVPVPGRFPKMPGQPQQAQTADPSGLVSPSNGDPLVPPLDATGNPIR